MTDRILNSNQQQPAFDPPAPDPELKRLEPLVGTWKTNEHTRDSILGPGVPITNDETFYWLERGYFSVQTYATTFGSEPAQKGIKVNPDGTISVAWWLRDEKGEFQFWMENVFRRVGARDFTPS